MNKTYTVNIGGVIFNIDHNAYEILNSYLDSVKLYFFTLDQEGEIIKDFELRIAENFSSKTTSDKNIISLIDVKKMISVMGTLEDFESAHDFNEEQQDSIFKDESPKKIFRDSSNKILGGVCSGIARYLKVDPVFIRAGFVILTVVGFISYLICWISLPSKEFKGNYKKLFFRDIEDQVIGGVAKGISNYLNLDVTLIRVILIISIFLNGFGVLVYLILWFFTKEAKTIGQKMNMSGYRVTISNVEEFFKKKTKKTDENEKILIKILLFPFRLISPILNKIIYILSKFLKIIFFMFLSFLTIIPVILIFLLAATQLGYLETFYNDFFEFELFNEIPNYFITTMYISLILTVLLIVVVSVKVLFNKSNIYVFILVFTTWLIFTAFNIVATVKVFDDFQEKGLISKMIIIKSFKSNKQNFKIKT